MRAHIASVDTIGARAFRDDFLLARRPLVLRGAARAMPAFERWTDGYLTKRLGDALTVVRFADGSRARMRFADYLGYVAEPDAYRSKRGAPYMVDFQFRRLCPALADDAPCPLPLEEGDLFASLPEHVRPELCWLYAGPAGTGSKMHQDTLCTHAWLAQLRGHKRWTMYARDDFEPTRGPRAGAIAAEAVLGPGDVVFVPSLTWHAVENVGPSVAVTANFCDASVAADAIADARARGHAGFADALGERMGAR